VVENIGCLNGVKGERDMSRINLETMLLGNLPKC